MEKEFDKKIDGITYEISYDVEYVGGTDAHNYYDRDGLQHDCGEQGKPEIEITSVIAYNSDGDEVPVTLSDDDIERYAKENECGIF